MEVQGILRELQSLAQLDVDAYHAYGQAIEKIDHEATRKQLAAFQEDHRRHYDELYRVIQEMGQEPPSFTKDFKGYIISGVTSLRSSAGTKGALEAMESNEKLTNKKYRQASSRSLVPKDILLLLLSFYQDEQGHLNFVQKTLKEKVWEKAPA